MTTLHPAPISSWSNVLCGFIAIKVRLKLSEEDADIVGKWFKVVNSHSTMKDVFVFCSLLRLQNINNFITSGGQMYTWSLVVVGQMVGKVYGYIQLEMSMHDVKNHFLGRCFHELDV